jgi:ubiquinone/menaquinone biosynthesis C-methylase UbiE
MVWNAIVILLIVVAGLLALLLIVLKVPVRIAARFGRTAPCPVGLTWILDNPLRRRYSSRILDRVGIVPGETVLELGTGPGVFSLEAARMVGPRGRLLCVDIQPRMIEKVEARLREAGATNVETRVASAYTLPAEAGSIDRAFLVTVLAEIPDQARALRELHRVLKPGGVLSITEEFPDPDYPFAAETIRRVEPEGFRLRARAGSFWRYTLTFAKI